jgi:hypothetical protein
LHRWFEVAQKTAACVEADAVPEVAGLDDRPFGEKLCTLGLGDVAVEYLVSWDVLGVGLSVFMPFSHIETQTTTPGQWHLRDSTIYIKWVTLESRHSDIKLLIIESATGIVRLLSANNVYLRDNIADIVLLFYFICPTELLQVLYKVACLLPTAPLAVSFLLSPT